MGSTQGTTVCAVKYIPDMLNPKVHLLERVVRQTNSRDASEFFLLLRSWCRGALHPMETGCTSDTLQQDQGTPQSPTADTTGSAASRRISIVL
jgi:hypothetical protein